MACARWPNKFARGRRRIDPLAVTWGAEPTDALRADVHRVASAWKLPVYERPKGRGLGNALDRFCAVLVRSGRGFRLHDRHGELGVTPGLAQLRLKRLATETDHALRVTGITKGETVIDATVGLGADTRVFAARAGQGGAVIGLEASLPLAVLLREGLPLEPAWPGSAPIEVQHVQASDWLTDRAPKSADVVFFDPMFDAPKSASPEFGALRRFAVNTPIDRLTIDAAKRVARRCVVMKAGSPEVFPSLGLEALPPQRNASVFWGRWLA